MEARANRRNDKNIMTNCGDQKRFFFELLLLRSGLEQTDFRNVRGVIERKVTGLCVWDMLEGALGQDRDLSVSSCEIGIQNVDFKQLS